MIFDIIGRGQGCTNVESWEMIFLIDSNYFSRIPVMDNFLCPVNVQATVFAPNGWPQLIRAVIGNYC